MMKIPPRLWRMVMSYLVGPLLQALGSGLAGLVSRLLRRGPEPEAPEVPKTQPPETSPRRRRSRKREPPGGE